ncbi:uncharacterized protein EI90DRAFT_3128376 [Cantharellus anzutake]|uniref:uncharacterized protein n=1 Tax=Cantharellus anzutake TaxID=1750568 RepID=UPI001902E3EE|nr:uncharacterized protein EI90DRAFT_3128376 [Cantharellus anzutake]KAF8325859.1 hypothetical protein EI90DRAFT_3128376 [Cantharellus anzutake]
MSVWNGTHSHGMIRAGLDLEMPGPTAIRGAAFNAAFRSRKVSEQNIDDRVQDTPEESNDDPEGKRILREAASSIPVCGRFAEEEANALPLDPSIVKSIGVIGPNANNAVVSGWDFVLKFTFEATPEASPSSTLQRPPKELEGFTKTAVLQPRGSEDVFIGLAFGFFNDQKDMNRGVAEEDEFKNFVGPTLDDVQTSSSLELTETFSWI